MLVEKKSWKNLIKPVLKYLGIYFLIFLLFFILFKLGPGNRDIDAKIIIAIVIGSGFCWLYFVLMLCHLEKDFHQIIKINDLTILNNDELIEYGSELFSYGYIDEYYSLDEEFEKRHIDKSSKDLQIRKCSFNKRYKLNKRGHFEKRF